METERKLIALLVWTAIGLLAALLLAGQSLAQPAQDGPEWAAPAAANQPPPTVSQLEIPRYLGLWHEVARLPARFQKGCVESTAHYSLRPDGQLKVVNQCRDASGANLQSTGRGWQVTPDDPAKLKVQFFWPFSGDYWVLALDKNYQWALVGTPNRKYLWILSRSPVLDRPTFQRLVRQSRRLGYPVDQLLVSPLNQWDHPSGQTPP